MDSRDTNEQVVVTGCGWVTPWGCGSHAGVLKQAPQPLRAPASPASYWSIPDALLEPYADFNNEIKQDKAALISAIAMREACGVAGLDPSSLDAERTAIALGCAFSGTLGMINFAGEVKAQTARFVSPIHFPQTVGNYIAGALSRAFKIHGPNFTIASGARSGLDAIREGCSVIQQGNADVVFAGGVDTLSDSLAVGLGGSGAAGGDWDNGDNGDNSRLPWLSEGACFVILEPAGKAVARGAVPLARLGLDAPRDVPDTGPPAAPAVVSVALQFDPQADPQRIEQAASLFTSSGHPLWLAIHHWIGRCFAAGSAAQVAAVLGALEGLDVPVISPSNPKQVRSERLPSSLAAPLRALVVADGGEPPASVLWLERDA